MSVKSAFSKLSLVCYPLHLFGFLCVGHFSLPATREDVNLQREYMTDLVEAASVAMKSVSYVDVAANVAPGGWNPLTTFYNEAT